MTKTLIRGVSASLLLAWCAATALAQPDGERNRRPDDRGPGDRRPEGPRLDSPRGPMGPPPRRDEAPGGIDARIARLEHKLDAVLHELRELRRDQSPRFAQRGPGPDREFNRPAGPPRGDGDRFGPPARRMDGPPDEMRRQPPRDDSHRDRANRDRDQDRNRPGPPRGPERDRRDDDLSF